MNQHRASELSQPLDSSSIPLTARGARSQEKWGAWGSGLHIAAEVMAQERPDGRFLDGQAERAPKLKPNGGSDQRCGGRRGSKIGIRGRKSIARGFALAG